MTERHGRVRNRHLLGKVKHTTECCVPEIHLLGVGRYIAFAYFLTVNAQLNVQRIDVREIVVDAHRTVDVIQSADDDLIDLQRITAAEQTYLSVGGSDAIVVSLQGLVCTDAPWVLRPRKKRI